VRGHRQSCPSGPFFGARTFAVAPTFREWKALGFPRDSGENGGARASRPLWRERPAPARRTLSPPLKRGPSQPQTRRNRARAGFP